jgi:hypothetical protein
VVARGTDNAVWHNWWSGVAWSNWESLGGTCLGDPGIGSWGPNALDVFCLGGTGTSGVVRHKYWRTGRWAGWAQEVPGVWPDGVAVSSWATNRLDVFGVDASTDALGHDWWDGTRWNHETLDGGLTTTPAAVSWGPNRIDVFALGGDGVLYHKIWG